MIESIKLIYRNLLSEVREDYHRYLYHKFTLDDRLIGLVGARGVGKTTMLLQIIKKMFDDPLTGVIYFSADHIFFSQTTIYEFVEELYLNEHITTFFIDEIHKYENWNQELKNLYDGFPKIKIIFSGSSSLDLIKGSYDLSRRAVMHQLPGLSFREYLNSNTDSNFEPVTFEQLVNGDHKLDQTLSTFPRIKGHFKDYLKNGYYPFYYENPLTYYEKILQVIEKTIFEDIANFYNLRTENLGTLKKILTFLASITPGSTSVHNIAKNLSMDDKTVTGYIMYLAETGLLNQIFPAEPGNVTLRRPEKIFLNNTNLQFALEYHMAPSVELGTIRELYVIQSVKSAGIDIHHSKKGDYQINKTIIEIGGKNKTRSQIKNLDNAFLVKDDILTSSKGVIPLMFFGFLY